MTTEGDRAPGDGDWPAVEGEPARGPLAGLRVLDLSRILAGPFATMQLSDLGADVIKVESPDHGDETRHWGPPFNPDGIATYYLAINRGKRSLTLNLADPRAAAIARRLAVSADVVVDNFLPGRLARWGLDLEALRRDNPRLITVTISGFGRDNQYAGRPGFDFLTQAMGGMMGITGQPGGEPTRVGVAISDIVTGLFAAQGVLAALADRDRAGRGRHVEVSLLDSTVAILINLASGWLNGATSPGLYGNAHPSIAPYETFATADEPIAVAIGTDSQFGRLTEALGDPTLAADPRFVTNQARVRHRLQLHADLEARLRAQSRAHWLRVLPESGVPVAPVNSLPEVFADPVIQSRMVTETAGIKQLRSPVRIDGAALPIGSPPPRLGEHTVAILLAMGLDDASIAALHRDGDG
jgi:crotonobetainyl-CoA:carnitine CoA-transferase CaiB-like acyl-CoA transferase